MQMHKVVIYRNRQLQYTTLGQQMNNGTKTQKNQTREISKKTAVNHEKNKQQQEKDKEQQKGVDIAGTATHTCSEST